MTTPEGEWTEILACIPPERPAAVAPYVPSAPRRVPPAKWERPVQNVLPLTPAPTLGGDEVLTPDELAALSRKGWELQSSIVTAHGLTLIAMLNVSDPDHPTEQRTPGGWRMELT